MPANTPKGYPYPLGTDRLMDGDDAIHNLATAIDTKVGVVAAGVVSITTAALNTPVALAVTFPAGLFTAAPSLVCTPGGGNPHQTATSWSAVTAAGANVWAVKTGGSVGAVTVNYIAVQTV